VNVTELLIIGGVVLAAVFGAALGYQLEVRRRKRAQAIQRRETTAIGALREGQRAKIRGVAAAREPLLTSPVSGQTCLGYQILIEDVTPVGGPLGKPHVRREAWSSFLVTDETGTAAVQGPLEILLEPRAGGVNLPAGAYALLREDKVPMNDVRIDEGAGRHRKRR